MLVMVRRRPSVFSIREKRPCKDTTPTNSFLTHPLEKQDDYGFLCEHNVMGGTLTLNEEQSLCHNIMIVHLSQSLN